MHRLTRVSIQNYRSCADVTVQLAAYTPLVGQNNCGKSNIIGAISWLLRPYALTASEFGVVSSEVMVSGEIAGLTNEHLAKLTPEHRARIEPFCATGRLTIRRVQLSPGGGRAAVTLDVRDPAVPTDDGAGAWKRNPTGIDAAIQALFPEPIQIAAMQDAAADVTSGKKESTIGKLIASVIGVLEQSHGAHLSVALEDIRRKLSAVGEDRAVELKEFDSGANENIKALFPGLHVRLHFEPPALADLFKSGTIKVFEGAEQEERDVHDLGHGAQRTIQIALIRYLASVARASDEATCTLLLIDEPELYLHPYAIEQVRESLLQLSESGFQVVFSTHSPLLIGIEDVAKTVMVFRPTEGPTRVRKRIVEAWDEAVVDAPSQSQRLFEFGNASRILFASRVLIAEGDVLLQLKCDTTRSTLWSNGGCHESLKGSCPALASGLHA
ncbi:ATP-dependent nuclease [Gemmatimonas sp.]|uniref:ATP-dependent nuclease n=1 Tax=Gemmatimonas sp. TaxID=1962908 RepID=UPI003F6FCF2D